MSATEYDLILKKSSPIFHISRIFSIQNFRKFWPQILSCWRESGKVWTVDGSNSGISTGFWSFFDFLSFALKRIKILWNFTHLWISEWIYYFTLLHGNKVKLKRPSLAYLRWKSKFEIFELGRIAVQTNFQNFRT